MHRSDACLNRTSCKRETQARKFPGKLFASIAQSPLRLCEIFSSVLKSHVSLTPPACKINHEHRRAQKPCGVGSLLASSSLDTFLDNCIDFRFTVCAWSRSRQVWARLAKTNKPNRAENRSWPEVGANTRGRRCRKRQTGWSWNRNLDVTASQILRQD